MIYELQDPDKASSLFSGWQDSVVWSALQGVMGKIYVDSLENPSSGAVMLGDFCFLSGIPMEEVAKFIPADCQLEERILVPQNEEWADLLQRKSEKSHSLCHKKRTWDF